MGRQPQPQKQRIDRITQVFVQPANDFDVGFLEHVGSVDASLQAAVQAQLHHAQQPSPCWLKILFTAAWSPARARSRRRAVSAELLSISVPIRS